MMTESILEKMATGPVLGDGGYVLFLEKQGVIKSAQWTPEGVLTHPEAVRAIHEKFLDAGSEVLQAQTWAGTRGSLDRSGAGDKVQAINSTAVRLAKQVAGDRALVAGTVSFVGEKKELVWSSGGADQEPFYQEQVDILVEEKVDFLLLETFLSLADGLTALKCAKRSGLPVMITITFKELDQTEDGYSAAQACQRLSGEGADIVGMNCHWQPELMLPLMDQIRAAVDGFVGMQPPAIRGENFRAFNSDEGWVEKWPGRVLTPQEMADYARRANDSGINFIGACCGTDDSHIKAMAGALEKG